MEAQGQGIYAVFCWAAKGTKWEAGLAGLMGTRVRLVERSAANAVVGHKGTWQQWEAQTASIFGTAVEAEV